MCIILTVFKQDLTIRQTVLIVLLTCILVRQYSKTNEMHFLRSIFYELTASTCFEHNLLIFISVGCYQGWSSTPTLVAANRHNTHAKYQLLFVHRLLKMSKLCSNM
jgi:hypothetical protein